MNRYFKDTRYYVRRASETARERATDDTRYYVLKAGKTATKGVATELEPLGERVRRVAGEDEEGSRFEGLQSDLREFQDRAEGEAREVVTDVRERLQTLRTERAS